MRIRPRQLILTLVVRIWLAIPTRITENPSLWLDLLQLVCEVINRQTS